MRTVPGTRVAPPVWSKKLQQGGYIMILEVQHLAIAPPLRQISLKASSKIVKGERSITVLDSDVV